MKSTSIIIIIACLLSMPAQAEHQTTLIAIDIRPFSCQKQLSRHRTGPNSDIPVAIYRYNVTPERFNTLRDVRLEGWIEPTRRRIYKPGEARPCAYKIPAGEKFLVLWFSRTLVLGTYDQAPYSQVRVVAPIRLFAIDTEPDHPETLIGHTLAIITGSGW